MEKEVATSSRKGISPHPIGIKRQAVAEVESGMYRRSEVCQKYGINKKTLEKWLKKLGSDVSPPPPLEERSETMRLAANEVLCGVFTVEEALREHGLESADRLRHWVERTRRENQSMRAAASAASCDIAQMKKRKDGDGEAAKLREELEAARMRVVALETLIEVAERELGVQIRKKSGTKRSRK
ncbi:MAG: hypothetical protein U0176_26880 [Bacteroidia bacterium]